jgi:hypothetical protein
MYPVIFVFFLQRCSLCLSVSVVKLVCPVIRELHINPKILLLQQRDDRL